MGDAPPRVLETISIASGSVQAMLSEVRRAGHEPTAGLSHLSTPASILMCYGNLERDRHPRRAFTGWLRRRLRLLRLRAAEALCIPLPPLGRCGHIRDLLGRTRVSDPWMVCQVPGSNSVWRCLEEQLRRAVVLDGTGHEHLGHSRRRYC
jgi:hypothetical protein